MHLRSLIKLGVVAAACAGGLAFAAPAASAADSAPYTVAAVSPDISHFVMCKNFNGAQPCDGPPCRHGHTFQILPGDLACRSSRPETTVTFASTSSTGAGAASASVRTPPTVISDRATSTPSPSGSAPAAAPA